MNNKIISTLGLIDLAQPRLGSKIIYKTNEFFGEANRIISPDKPIWKEGVYDNNGKWMDGWETRRLRSNGNDSLILHLGRPGKINYINVDTSFFNGNQPQYISIEGCYSDKKSIDNNVAWNTLVKKSKVKPNNNNFFRSKNNKTFSHIRLSIFPDGGVARLRVFGKITLGKHHFIGSNVIELSSIINGSTIIAVNNEHFGKAENILAPGRAFNMGDGWETRRRRSKGNDWLIFKFGIPGKIKKIIIDTSHFKGNFPDQFSIQGEYIKESKKISKKLIIKKSNKWKSLIEKTKLYENREHSFDNILFPNKLINYIKLNIFPDGGIARLNIFGIKVK